jgi:hypothetical protein
MSYSPNASSFDLDILYYIYESQLPSGKYYMEIFAQTSGNSKRKQKEIHLNGIPLKLSNILIFTRNNVNTTGVYKADSTMQFTLSKLFACDYGQSCVYSSKKSLFLAGKSVGLLSYTDLVTNAMQWSQVFPSTASLPFFVHIYPLSDDVILAGCSDGIIREYDVDGTFSVYSDYGLNNYALRMVKFKTYVAVNVINKTSFDSYLKIQYYPSGAVYQEKPIDFRVSDMFVLDNDKLILFGNVGTNGKLAIFSLSSNSVTDAHSFPSEKILNVSKIDSANYLISTPQNIYVYHTITNSLSSFVQNTSHTKVRFEAITNQVFVCTTHQLSVYSYTGGILKNSYPVSDTLLDCQFQYNK